MMECREIDALLKTWESGGPLGEDEIASALEHRDACATCRERYASIFDLLAREASGGAAFLLGPPPGPGFSERVLGRIEGRRRGSAGPRRWLLLAAAAALFFAGLGLGSRFLAAGKGDSASVLFVLDAPDAKSVSLVGDFNQWNPAIHSLHRSAPGQPWELRLELPRGRMYVYDFVVDGVEWVPDPLSQTRVKDGFGGSSSLLRL